MKAVWNEKVIAEADREDLIYIEGNWYFPPSSVNMEMLKKSETPYTCPWKGECLYYDIGDSEDAAWTYEKPYEPAIEKVKKDFSNYVAFWRGVSVED